MQLLQSIVAAVFLLTTCLMQAFPRALPAIIAVSPWVPASQQNVIITITASESGFLPGSGVVLERVQSNVAGYTITINAHLAKNSQSSDQVTFPVDLGKLPPGRYTVDYLTGDPGPQDALRRATLSFSVADSGLVDAVEFFNVARGHYFVTADPGEIAKLDQGIIVGWSRTGETFKVMSAATMPTSALPVCRFYGLPSAGLDSHFFSTTTEECADVLVRWPGQWILETNNAFGVAWTAFGQCNLGTQSLYRLYNNRADVNHRYTTSPQTRDAMLAQGWILEGSAANSTSRDFVAMCLPQ